MGDLSEKILSALRARRPAQNAGGKPAETPAPPAPNPVEPLSVDVGHYRHFQNRMPSIDGSAENPSRPLYTESQAAAAVAELRAMLVRDATPECRAALQGEIMDEIRSFAGQWFQRIDYPEHRITSTSDPSMAHIDEGSFNTLGHRLTSREASILRPWPKWFYLRPLLPELQGKSVLEVGASNGFFSFRFAELGASQVTGVEIVRRQHESAVWSAGILGYGNVTFLHTDFLLDQSLEPHDVVFLSEVHNHFLFPFLGLVKLVALARETLILDTVTMDLRDHSLMLDSGWDMREGRLMYHTFHLSHGLLLDFLNLIGVAPSKVTRYQASDDTHHSLYWIDTSGVEAMRARGYYSEYLEDVFKLRFKP